MNARRGRPRSEQARLAVLDAAVDLLRADGYDRLTIDAVATRAGVGRQTIYRWWGSKASIVAEAVLEGRISLGGPAIVDTGDLRADLRGWTRALVAAAGDAEEQAVIRALTAAAADGGADADALYRRLTSPGHEALVTRLAAGASDPTDPRLHSAADAVFGTVLYRVLTGAPMTPDAADALTGLLLTGLDAPS
ncbi:TetR/AcrR family transcriptional regulator [Microbacterium fluvii]|uniref:TetR/AcrR family transcriptional regulator n=1 Tax=Microbacterium fluvii TaxID=415215 RepID=A0ABW2HF69_9MICO|nr:TetR/AcrR family transcriptional regulator [Microbacterium fluvii]MCU4673254.1 TetR/AcrR family transcriptional regulator [Microbacterium fluvii]